MATAAEKPESKNRRRGCNTRSTESPFTPSADGRRSVPATHLFLCCLLFILIAAVPGVSQDERAEYRSGSDFRRELDKPVTVTRSDAELRPMFARLAADRGIAIVIDRRVDPGREIDANLAPSPLLHAIEQIAAQAEAVVSVVGDTVFVGSPESTAKLRTLCVLRAMELDEFGEALGPRDFELARTHSFAWDDLERPADLLLRVAQRGGLMVEGLELIPHDLWSGGTFVGVTPIEAVSLVLIQFDLTFEWTGAAEGIRLVPAPPQVAVTRTHAVRVIAPATARDLVQERFPDVPVEIAGRQLTATATVEQHADIAVLSRGDDPDEDVAVADFGPLARRRFTLRVVRQPAGAVLQTLQANDVDVQYDAEALAAAGIDLTTKISLDLKQATADELLTALCEPLGLEYEIQGEQILIRTPAGEPERD